MSLLSRLDAKFGRYAVPNLTVIVIAGQVLVYLTEMFAQNDGRSVVPLIQFSTAAVLEGEVWRLVTFLFSPPTMNALFAFFFWYLFYLFGTTLEADWGVFRYNVFLAVGYVASLVAAIVTALVFGNGVASNGFLYGSVFLAFARLYPEFVMYLFFILPVKIKWLALLQWVLYAWTFLVGGWLERAMVAASVFNYLLFFGRSIWFNMKHAERRMRFQAQTMGKSSRLVHRCHVCGLSSDDAPRTQFRYCSQCGGDVCYCPEHLQNHEHVTSSTAT
jgi:hypothetical protein